MCIHIKYCCCKATTAATVIHPPNKYFEYPLSVGCWSYNYEQQSFV